MVKLNCGPLSLFIYYGPKRGQWMTFLHHLLAQQLYVQTYNYDAPLLWKPEDFVLVLLTLAVGEDVKARL